MDLNIDVKLQQKQCQLHDLLIATGKRVPTVIGFGGAKGGGKSAGVRNCALLLLTQLGKLYPGIKITIVRRVFDDLKKNHIDPLLDDYPQLRQYYSVGNKELVIPGLGKLIFAHAETSDDVKRKFLGGFESGFIFVDEAQQFSQEELQWITTAARWTKTTTGIPEGLAKTAFLFNPGGVGSAYIRRIFWLKQYEDKEKPHSYAFIHVFGWDNYEWFRGQVDIEEADFYQLDSEERFEMFITQTSEGRKYDAFPQSIRAGYLLGSFDHFEGQYFAGAWDKSLCVISPALTARLLETWWTHWMATDWGWAGPPKPHYSVNLWFSIGKLSPALLADALKIQSDYPLDVVIVWQERFACLTPEPEVAQMIVDATPLTLHRTMARHFVDGSVFSKDRRSENTTADLMQPILQEAGLPRMVPADKDRIGGWRQLYNAFVRTCNARKQPVTEVLDGPLLLISADCPEVARSVPQVICDPDRPEDVLKTECLEDDMMDTLRYGWKSMQGAQWEAPIEVRRKEVYDQYEAPTPEERTGSQMTSLALAMRRFDAEQAGRFKRVRTRR